MKNLYLIALLSCFLYSSNTIAADEYTQCLDLNYQTNEGLIKCANEETARIMDNLEKRYGTIANHKYFRSWNNASHSFAELKDSWIKYRNHYCNLLGFSIEKTNDPYGQVEAARCVLRETIRFRSDIENLVTIYQKTLKQPKL